MIDEGNLKLISKLEIKSMLDLPDDFFNWDPNKLKAGCKILGIGFGGQRNMFVKKDTDPERDLFTWIKAQYYYSISFIFIYEVLNKNHPSFEYYNYMSFINTQNFVDIKTIFRAEKLKAFI